MAVAAYQAPGRAELMTSMTAHARESNRQALDRAVYRAGRPPLDVDLRVTCGSPAEMLLAAAEDADVLIFGTRG